MDPVGKETLEIMRTVRWYNQWLFGLIQKNLRGKILEVGSGIGNFTSLLATKGKVFAVDKDKGYIKDLKKSLPSEIKVGFGDIESGRTEFGSMKFDAIVCMNVLEHIKKDEDALLNMQKRLKKGGNLILLVPAFKFAYGKLDSNLGHERRYSKIELTEKIADAGFRMKEINYVNLFGIIGWFINARILKRNIIPKGQLEIFNIAARPLLALEKHFKPPFGLSLLVVGTKIK